MSLGSYLKPHPREEQQPHPLAYPQVKPLVTKTMAAGGTRPVKETTTGNQALVFSLTHTFINHCIVIIDQVYVKPSPKPAGNGSGKRGGNVPPSTNGGSTGAVKIKTTQQGMQSVLCIRSFKKITSFFSLFPHPCFYLVYSSYVSSSVPHLFYSCFSW